MLEIKNLFGFSKFKLFNYNKVLFNLRHYKTNINTFGVCYFPLQNNKTNFYVGL
jgi:hypothetical protein